MKLMVFYYSDVSLSFKLERILLIFKRLEDDGTIVRKMCLILKIS